MKKVFFGIGLIAVVFVLSGCRPFWQKPLEVNSISFYLDDGALPPQYYSEATLKVVPTYKSRELAVDYSRTFPYRTSETKDTDIKNSGKVGGEFFEKFEKILEMYEIGELKEIKDSEACTGGSNFSVSVADLNGKSDKLSFYLCGKNINDDLAEITSYYYDIVDMLTQDVY